MNESVESVVQPNNNNKRKKHLTHLSGMLIRVLTTFLLIGETMKKIVSVSFEKLHVPGFQRSLNAIKGSRYFTYVSEHGNWTEKAHPWGVTVKWQQREGDKCPLETRVNSCHTAEMQSLVLWPQMLVAHTPPKSTKRQQNDGCAHTVVWAPVNV